MKVVIWWSDGVTTTMDEVVAFREPNSVVPCFKIEGRTSQTYISAVAVKRVQAFPDEEVVE